MIVIKKFVFNPFYENTYLIWDEDTLQAMLIDPGCSDSNEEKVLTDYISDRNLKITALLNTHCHIDHILGCFFVKSNFSVPYYAPQEDLPLLENADKQASAFGMEIEMPPKPDIFINEMTTISLGDSQLIFFFTPGHTPGEYCFYFEKEKFCITGDVLFKGSIGRTDLWGGDYNLLLKSIKTKLLSLPDEVIIYPGHGENSSMGEEKKNNPFLRDLI
jgi:glyoxylase-like metal-dependent hydrolase (beta-lactamase superfamily II)